MPPKTDSEKPATLTTKTDHDALEQPILTTEEAAKLRRSSKEAIAEFRAILERKRKLGLEK